jgi:hypothetical protein
MKKEIKVCKEKETFVWWGNVQYYMEQNGGPQISVSPVTLSGPDQKKLSMTQLKMKRVKKKMVEDTDVRSSNMEYIWNLY